MDEDLRTLHETLVMRQRLQALAQLQAGYLADLVANGFDQAFAEQLVAEWSRSAYGTTHRAIPETTLDGDLADLLAPDAPSDAPDESGATVHRIPFGENWLEPAADAEAEDEGDSRAA